MNQQSQMFVFGLGKHRQSGRNCLQFTLQKASNNPKSFTFGNLLKVPTTEARFFQLDGQYGISNEKEEEAGFAKRRADYSS